MFENSEEDEVGSNEFLISQKFMPSHFAHSVFNNSIISNTWRLVTSLIQALTKYRDFASYLFSQDS